MSDYEPGAGRNLPAGCFDVPDTSMGDTCMECKWSIPFGCSGVVCALELGGEVDGMQYGPQAVLEIAADMLKPGTTDACGNFEAE